MKSMYLTPKAVVGYIFSKEERTRINFFFRLGLLNSITVNWNYRGIRSYPHNINTTMMSLWDSGWTGIIGTARRPARAPQDGRGTFAEGRTTPS